VARDAHIEQTNCGAWRVTGGNIRGRHRYTLRDHALAFARAIANANEVDLYVHHRDGAVVRQATSSLTYPAILD
jgi:hypothetical protein